MNRWLGLGLLLVVVGAVGLRCPVLDRRPMHNDEAVNALKIQGLWERGTYAYDPNEYHGPALFYATLPFLWLGPAPDFSQLTEKTLRLVPVFFGVGLIVLLWFLGDALGRTAALFAGVLTAISPAMVFYSRYFIHEMLLVCFTMIVLVAGWRYTRTRRLGWAALGGSGLGLMATTKETFVIALGAMAGAAVLIAWWKRKEDGRPLALQSFWNPKHALTALVLAMAVAVALFSSFFSHWSGLIDSLRTFTPWLRRAGGQSPHVHPFGFYFERLAFFHQPKGPVWSEGLVLFLAGVGLLAAFTRKGLGPANVWFVRFIALYAMTLSLAYSAISYKTPWCMLGFLHGLILLAGVGAVALLQFWRRKAVKIGFAIVLAFASINLGWQAWRASYIFVADGRNPYVYAQTVPDILRLIHKVEAVAKVDPQGREMLLKVAAPAGDYWPLPWYLRQFKKVGWWNALPPDPYAPIVIVGSKLDASLDDKSNKGWLMVGLFELRPKTFFELYVQADLWRRYVEGLPKDRN